MPVGSPSNHAHDHKAREDKQANHEEHDPQAARHRWSVYSAREASLDDCERLQGDNRPIT